MGCCLYLHSYPRSHKYQARLTYRADKMQIPSGFGGIVRGLLLPRWCSCVPCFESQFLKVTLCQKPLTASL